MPPLRRWWAEVVRPRPAASPCARPSEPLEPRRLLAAEPAAPPPEAATPEAVLTAPLQLDDFRRDPDGVGYEVDGTVRLPGGQALPFTADAAVDVSQADDLVILDLTLGPVDLDLLGLRLDLQQLGLRVSAQPGEGQVLGNLLSDLLMTDEEAALDAVTGPLNEALAGVFNGGGTLGGALPTAEAFEEIDAMLADEAEVVLGEASLLDAFADAPLASASAQPDLPEEVRVLSLEIAELDLLLLGLRVETTTPVDLSVTAQAGPGRLLGNLFVGLSSLLDPLLPELPPGDAPTPSNGPSSLDQIRAGEVPVLSLELRDVNLDLLGLGANLNVDLLVALEDGPGDLLGGLLLSELQQIEDEIEAAGFEPLRELLGFLFDGGGLGVGDALADEAMLATAPALDAAPLVADDTAGDPGPISLVNLSIDQVDLDLLGVLIKSQGIALDLRADPGPGALLGNLLARLIGGLEGDGGLPPGPDRPPLEPFRDDTDPAPPEADAEPAPAVAEADEATATEPAPASPEEPTPGGNEIATDDDGVEITIAKGATSGTTSGGGGAPPPPASLFGGDDDRLFP